MWASLEPWQLQQLQRLGTLDKERVETILNTLWHSFPGLLDELAISAVDQEMLSVEQCAARLDLTTPEVQDRLLAFRRCAVPETAAICYDDAQHVARLSQAQLPVWELVREYRKLGSVERLRDAFPSISEGELAAGLRYAEAHPEEIEKLISGYERMLAQRRAEYPYAR